jgi:hypothetical protein
MLCMAVYLILIYNMGPVLVCLLSPILFYFRLLSSRTGKLLSCMGIIHGHFSLICILVIILTI